MDIYQRLLFLRVVGVEQKFMLLFYRAALKSTLRYKIIAWSSNLMNHLVQHAIKIEGDKEIPLLQAISGLKLASNQS